ncbi:FMN-linked oxidoreductase [Ascoidea rubescens DSM 1968]|uniref:FMN-linked oxidoreductase n=1 Tax=Ascoidea rubescens DSM 1968 TaxID=1344418 RepID=A0A1D2VJM8_9ASCO|nr:FMN-linked oxidoreductase [Ascoidea rubescens DSM 1968]ODV61819.1 FMN-linked oxidoreductase [Ascoidea rubescens DSM 1968]
MNIKLSSQIFSNEKNFSNKISTLVGDIQLSNNTIKQSNTTENNSHIYKYKYNCKYNYNHTDTEKKIASKDKNNKNNKNNDNNKVSLNYGLADSNLFNPIQVGNMLLQTRLVICPLSRCRATVDNLPSNLMYHHYIQRSLTPGTLIISEATSISLNIGGTDHNPGIYNERQIYLWSKIISKIHKNNCFFFIQLQGHGKIQPLNKLNDLNSNTDWSNLPNDLKFQLYNRYYFIAAQNAILAGADGIEISVYHYLLLVNSLNLPCFQNDKSLNNNLKVIQSFLKLCDQIIGKVSIEKFALRFGFLNRIQISFILNHFNKKNLKLAYISIIEPRIKNIHSSSENSTQSNDWIYSYYKNGIVLRSSSYFDNYQETNFKTLKAHINSNNRTLIGCGRYSTSNPDLNLRLFNNLKLNPYNRMTFYTNTSLGYNDFSHLFENENSPFYDNETNQNFSSLEPIDLGDYLSKHPELEF